MTVFSVGIVDGGVQTATIDDFVSAEVCVTPVFAVPPQAIVWIPGLTNDQVPITCALVCVFAINKKPRNVSLEVEPLIVTMIE